MGTKLYVGNLSFNTTETDLQDLFAQAGAVSEVTLMQDKFTGKSRGFAFVTMGNEADAQKAITDFNGKTVEGRPLTVNEARPREARPGGGGRRSRWLWRRRGRLRRRWRRLRRRWRRLRRRWWRRTPRRRRRAAPRALTGQKQQFSKSAWGNPGAFLFHRGPRLDPKLPFAADRADRRTGCHKKMQIVTRKVLPTLRQPDIVGGIRTNYAANSGNNSMTKFTKIALTIALTAGMTAATQAQISYTGGTYLQDFDSVGAAVNTDACRLVRRHRNGCRHATDSGRAGTGVYLRWPAVILVHAGVNLVGERALGSLCFSEHPRRHYANVDFTNNLGFNIYQFTVTYNGEQWRNGGSTVRNVLALQLSLYGTTWCFGSGWLSTCDQLRFHLGTAVSWMATLRRTGSRDRWDLFADPRRFRMDPYFTCAGLIIDDTGSDAEIAVDDFTFSGHSRALRLHASRRGHPALRTALPAPAQVRLTDFRSSKNPALNGAGFFLA